MTTDGKNTIRDEIREHIAAVSTQAQLANRFWLGLMTIVVIVLLPKPTNLEFSIGFGKVSLADAASFYLFLFLMLIVLTIGFSAAYAQNMRTQQHAQGFINNVASDPASHGWAHPREQLDMLRYPTLNRVAPLAQLLKGRYQFFPQESHCPFPLRLLAVVYYFLLKLTSMLVYFGLPVFALWLAYKNTNPPDALRWLLVSGGVLASLTLLQVFVTDSFYALKALRAIWRGDES
jgi:hypothetical protein